MAGISSRTQHRAVATRPPVYGRRWVPVTRMAAAGRAPGSRARAHCSMHGPGISGASLRPGRPTRGYNRAMSRFYRLDDANDLFPDLGAVVDRLREQREELVALRDAFRDAREGGHRDLIADERRRRHPTADDPELRRLRLRMRGIVDQMQADVAWLDDRDIVLRDIATGLLDFPALVSRTAGVAVLAAGRGPGGLVARH